MSPKIVTDQRVDMLSEWLRPILDTTEFHLSPVSGDASFRRYFRVNLKDSSYIAVDAPPQLENSASFVQITGLLSDYQVNAPTLFHYDLKNGFMLLEDFGDHLLLDQLNTGNVDQYYGLAIDALHHLQSIPADKLPPYDRALLLRELDLFRDWYLVTHLAITPDNEAQRLLDSLFELLIQSALEQPKVLVHRDYHSRNLMLAQDNSLGIIDYQDAVCGPFTYDLVSLLRDCYIAWPEQQVYRWAMQFKTHYEKQSGAALISDEQFVRWFDFMGMQRHMKAIGIFSRLHHRDNKSAYLHDIPRTMQYVLRVAEKYPELHSFENYARQMFPQDDLA